MRDYFLNMKTRVFNKSFKKDFGTDFFFTFKIVDGNILITRVNRKTPYMVHKKGKVSACFWRDLIKKLHVLPIELYYLALEKTRLSVKLLSKTEFLLLWHDYTA